MPVLRSGALLAVFCSALQTIEPQIWHRLKSAGKQAKDGSAVSDGVRNLSLLVGDRHEFPSACFMRLEAVQTPDDVVVGYLVVGDRGRTRQFGSNLVRLPNQRMGINRCDRKDRGIPLRQSTDISQNIRNRRARCSDRATTAVFQTRSVLSPARNSSRTDACAPQPQTMARGGMSANSGQRDGLLSVATAIGIFFRASAVGALDIHTTRAPAMDTTIIPAIAVGSIA